MRRLLYLTAFVATYGVGWFAAFTFFEYFHQKQFFNTVMDDFNWLIDGFLWMNCLYFFFAIVLTAYIRFKIDGSKADKQVWNVAFTISVIIPFFAFAIWFLKI